MSAVVNMYKNAKSLIKIGNVIWDPFPAIKGLKQGRSLSPTPFKVYIQDTVINWRRKCTGMGIEIKNLYFTNLFFADDQVIIADEGEDMNYKIRK